MSGTQEHTRPDTLVGNRWVLVGGVVYLLEWVAIIGASAAGLGSVVTRGVDADGVLEAYVGHADAASSMAGWFAVVLLGRVLVFVGLRRALADSGRSHVLLDVAVVSAAVSVTLEIASYGLAAAAADRAAAGDRAGTVLLDTAGTGLNLMIGGGLGVAIVAATYVMTRSGLFPTGLNALGWLSGVAIIGAQLSVAPSLETVFAVLYVFPLVFWVWMLWAGVLLWRRTPATAA
jgi:hypothetical protein